MTADLVDFLRARLADDERTAQAALGLLGMATEWWTADGLREIPGGDGHRFTLADAHFIARHDPARVLREVAAKRAIIDAVLRYEAYIDGEQGCCHGVDEIADGECEAALQGLTESLRPLAAVYADHPEYQDEWAV